MVLSTANLRTCYHHILQKIKARWVGLFCITKEISPVALRLDLRRGWWIHPIFHVSKLKRYIRSEGFLKVGHHFSSCTRKAIGPMNFLVMPRFRFSLSIAHCSSHVVFSATTALVSIEQNTLRRPHALCEMYDCKPARIADWSCHNSTNLLRP